MVYYSYCLITYRMFILDTCIYGVLVDRKHKEYERVKRILDYAKRRREQSITTFIVANELDDMEKRLQEIVLPEYYNSINSVIEAIIPGKYDDADKLAWRYIQKLGVIDAEKVYKDALNYAWACHAGIDTFVTINRRGLLAKEFQPTIKRINGEMRVNYVEIMTPKEFLDYLHL